ncbi:MAG: hypothetical protein KDD50_11910, partial [Bdellovibrionales bacterium]|nr:hypothetical protein [Bdellovibrionales bacterium]
MLVKKFEASTIQDALALVKNNLGPDAIILSAKEHKPKFGIGGSGSIEITAAISEGKLKVKEFAESKLSQAAREVFKNAPVQKQRDFIDKTLRSAQQEFARKSVQFTQQRYVDIQDEEPVVQDFPNINEQLDNQMTYEERGVNKAEEPRLSANNRIKSAVQEAWRAVQKTSPSEVRVGAKPVDNDTIESLKNEIKMLKQIINNFNNVPQNFISLHPGAVEGIPYELSYLYEHLKSNGINSKNSTELVQKVKSSLDPSLYKKKPYVNAYLAKYFLSYLKVCEERYEGKNHLFLGPHSQGKTSSLIKFASELVIKSKQKIAVVSLDTKKIGA